MMKCKHHKICPVFKDHPACNSYSALNGYCGRHRKYNIINYNLRLRKKINKKKKKKERKIKKLKEKMITVQIEWEKK